MIEGMDLKRELVNIFLIFVLIVALIFILYSVFSFVLCAFLREHNAVDINAENRDIIEILLPTEENIPDLSNAVRIDRLVLLHKNAITVSYEDGSEYEFYNWYEDPLIRYIRDEGYSIYFHSTEFFVGIIKVLISADVSSACVVMLIRKEKTKAT